MDRAFLKVLSRVTILTLWWRFSFLKRFAKCCAVQDAMWPNHAIEDPCRKRAKTHHRRPMGYENNVTALLNLLKKIFKYRYSSVLRVPEAMRTSYAIEDLGLKILGKRLLFFIISFLTVKTTHASLFNIFFFIYCSCNC